jgi:hypothetical protein
MAGRVLGPTVDIEVDLNSLARDVHARIGERADFGVSGAFASLEKSGWRVDESTQAALVREVECELGAEAERADRERATADERRRAAVAALEGFEADGVQWRSRDDFGYMWEEWVAVEPRSPSNCTGVDLPPDWEPRIAARRSALEQICAEHNAPHLAEVERLRVEHLARAERQRAADKLAREAADIEWGRVALESGHWELETGAYNERRHGAPWCARVTFPSGPKPVYEFGDSTAKWGKPGLLRVACRPGEVIAWGQKDLRNPGRGEHTIAVMESDGRMREVTKTEAYRLVTAVEGGAK